MENDMTLTPYGLQTEHRATPLGTDEIHPLFSWKLSAETSGRRQAAYQLQVEDARTGATTWDTGWTESHDPSGGLTYAGTPLQPMTRYLWHLTVRDQDGVASDATSTWFETGLLSSDAWSARWIRRDPRSLPPIDPPSDDNAPEASLWVSPPCRFRRAFDLPSSATSARAYVTARGVYRLYVNGARVGNDELTPGWTDYRFRLQYQTYDITDLLVEGANVVGAIVGDGWWSGYIGFDPRQSAQHYGRVPNFLAEIHVDCPDGKQVIVTDSSWTEQPGEVVWADALVGEFHDYRLATAGWDRPGFDDSAWSPALASNDGTSTLVGQLDEPVRVTDEFAARTVSRSPSGHQIIDFGQNLVGHLRVRLTGLPPGTHLTLRHGETLQDGELYTANLRSAKATDQVITASGDNAGVFEPFFTSHGFRYVEVKGYPGEVVKGDFTARVVHSDTPMVGNLHCADDLVEQLISNINWGQRGNFVSVPTDCPQRDERLGWTADAQIFLPTACYNADVAAFMSRWMLDVLDGQDEDGAFPDVAPVVILDREGAPAWGDAGVIVPYLLWRTYGDTRILRRCFPAMTSWVDHVHRHNPDLIWRNATGNNYGDWLQVDAATPRDVVATAYFARSASLVSEVAAVLGLMEQAVHYRDLAARTRASFTEEFAKPDGAVGGGTQTAQLMALAWDLITPELRPKAFEHLCLDLESRGVRLTTGFVGVPLLCPVLTTGGREDLAFELLQQEAFPSWGYSIRRGATTIWERWDGWTEERGFQSVQMNSFNHYALGSVGEWLWRSVAGIDQAPGSVAYRDLLIEPRLGGRLDSITASFDSPRGMIKVSWRRVPHGIGGRLEIPPGLPAEVRVPARNESDLTVDGQPAANHSAVEVVSVELGKAQLRIQPGSWSVESSI